MFVFLLLSLSLAQFMSESESAQLRESAQESFAAFSGEMMRRLVLAERQRKEHVAALFDEKRLETVESILFAIDQTLFRGSALYNAGFVSDCAQMYFASAMQIKHLFCRIGEDQMVADIGAALDNALDSSTYEEAAWAFRGVLESIVRGIQADPFYSELFDNEIVELNPGCAYGLLVKFSDDDVTVVVAQATVECDNEVEPEDAMFFIEELEPAEDPQAEAERRFESSSDARGESDETTEWFSHHRHHGEREEHARRHGQEYGEHRPSSAFPLFMMATALFTAAYLIRKRRERQERQQRTRIVVTPLPVTSRDEILNNPALAFNSM